MWVTALLIGFAGSLHCLGMCSPLALAVTGMKPSALLNRLLYNTGRIATYGLLGAVVAGLGHLLPLHKYQNLISISLGATLLFIGFGGVKNISIPGITPAMQRVSILLKRLFGRYLEKKTRAAMLVTGVLNGVLPCGLTLLALTWCLTLKGPLDGLYFMALFGAGTLPIMLGVTAMLPLVLKKLDLNMRKMTTAMIILSGCVMIARVFFFHLPHTATLKEGLVDIILCR